MLHLSNASTALVLRQEDIKVDPFVREKMSSNLSPKEIRLKIQSLLKEIEDMRSIKDRPVSDYGDKLRELSHWRRKAIRMGNKKS